MRNIVSSVFFALAIAVASSSVFADSVINVYTCTVKEGKSLKDVQAANSKWLAWVRSNVNEKIESSVGKPVVGDQSSFLFADSYPDLNTWAATQTALDTDAGREIESVFADVTDCAQNHLWKFEPTP